ncbi:hypothetical protein BC937DRAFT_90757 [Endogone sp. FLAS-F59071]|nr:hypothetical protein BC937DRAFT_90757 [Endogone sp. FLAS-F59071]|eukprot:RUS16818.1 hypothetical protein BC937DRAFT_90757 [Endogone sp. FLAS-F59071]
MAPSGQHSLVSPNTWREYLFSRKDGQVCKFFLRGGCSKGDSCQFRHHNNNGGRDKAVVCKHWLRGLCKKGDQCEFLHEFNLKKMPECWFYSQYRECTNGDDCLYLHVDPDAVVKECPWYARGFCKLGTSRMPELLDGALPAWTQLPERAPKVRVTAVFKQG